MVSATQVMTTAIPSPEVRSLRTHPNHSKPIKEEKSIHVFKSSKDSLNTSKLEVTQANFNERKVSFFKSPSATSLYCMGTGDLDAERLVILAELYNPSSLEFLQLELNHDVLSIGCGTLLLELEIAAKVKSLLAIDRDEEQIKIATKNLMEKAAKNIELKQLDLADLDTLSPRLFDRVHCRLVLSHIPFESIENLIPKMLARVTPGGALVLEEMSTLDHLKCEPEIHEGYRLWKQGFHDQLKKQGCEIDTGERLHNYFEKSDYDFTYQTFQPALDNQRKKSILALGTRSIKPKILETGLRTIQEIDDMLEKFVDLEKSTLVPYYCELSQFFIKKPLV